MNPKAKGKTNDDPRCWPAVVIIMFTDELAGNPAKKRADEAKARRLRAKREKEAKELRKRKELERRERDAAATASEDAGG